MTDLDPKDYPSNSKTVQKKKRMSKQKQSVPIRTEDEMIEEGLELSKRKKIKPVGPIPRVKKKNIFQKASNAIFGGGEDGVGQYIIWDVLIPAAKTTIQDMVTSGIELLLFGNVSHRSRRESGGYQSYGSYFNTRDAYGRKIRKSPASKREFMRVPGYHNRLNGIYFESRAEAEEVLDALGDILDKYELVSIADFYELAGLENISQYTDRSWGWTSLGRARIMHSSDGFEIDFPKPIELD